MGTYCQEERPSLSRSLMDRVRWGVNPSADEVIFYLDEKKKKKRRSRAEEEGSIESLPLPIRILKEQKRNKKSEFT